MHNTTDRHAIVAPLYPLRFELPSSQDGTHGRRVLVERPVKYVVRAFVVNEDGLAGAPVSDWSLMGGASERLAANGVLFRHRGLIYAFGDEGAVKVAVKDSLIAAGYAGVVFAERQ